MNSNSNEPKLKSQVKKDQSKNMLPPHWESSGARRAKKKEQKSKKGLAFCLPAGGGDQKEGRPTKKGRPPTKRKQKAHQKKEKTAKRAEPP